MVSPCRSLSSPLAFGWNPRLGSVWAGGSQVSLRGWYTGCALAFQAIETSSSLVPRPISKKRRISLTLKRTLCRVVNVEFEKDCTYFLAYIFHARI